jgi:hypothetical protein
MVVVPKLVPALILLGLLLAGCTSGGGGGNGDGNGGDGTLEEPPQVEATATTGGIRGVVVDEAIRPIKAATVLIQPANKSLESDDNGLFAISGLEPGEYVVSASHPLYNEIQATTTVVAGDSNPKSVKLQLTRVILANPYKETLHFEGYIFCSQDFSGALFSEECGEGAGVPCAVPLTGTPVPVVGCQRLGGQSNNNVQYDFYPAVDYPKSLLVELNWEPTVGAATTGALWTIVATDFICDPTCGGKEVMNYGGEKYEGDTFGNCATGPSYIRQDDYVQTLNGTDGKPDLKAGTRISTFTWACGKNKTLPPDPVFGFQPGYDIELQQKFDEFVTISYYLPLPEAWSFVAGDPDPFV